MMTKLVWDLENVVWFDNIMA